MYRHLLVPIDATELSVEVVGNAVALARSLGARITFFHVVADHAASLRGEAELLRTAAPADYDYAIAGKARELLAKAEAAARAFGVPCEPMHVVGNQPAAAIIAAARERGCDLIFMASHGKRSRLGMALASETLAVLMNAGLPVLVSSTGERRAPARAIAVIRDEHRSLAAVLHAWMHLLAQARSAGTDSDVTLMRAIVQYLRAFPLRLHHPKEEAFLFARLRERAPAVAMELDELARQHERDVLLVDELAALVEALTQAPDNASRSAGQQALEQAVGRYAAFLWEHMGREEGVILPAAQQHLHEQDWIDIDAAFAANGDPRLDTDLDREYKRLFSRIVNLSES